MGQIKITNNYLPTVTWLNPAECPFIANDTIDVWKISVNSNLSMLENFKAIMKPGELERAGRYYHLKDQNRYIVSRGALRNILGKYLHVKPVDVEFGVGKNKKPHVITGVTPTLQYNLSHSGDMIILAVSDSAIGADVEFINPGFDYSEVLEGNFSADEISYISDLDSLNRFFRLWTRKEAVTKATAQGLDCDLRLLPSLDGRHYVQNGVIASENDWEINSFNLSTQYTVSIAGYIFPTKLAFWDLEKMVNTHLF